MPIEIGMTRENASAWLMGATYAAASTRRISSVAYAVEESASDEKTARAVFFVSRSCVKRAVLIGLPTSRRFNEAIFSLRQPALQDSKREKMPQCAALKSADCGGAYLMAACCSLYP